MGMHHPTSGKHGYDEVDPRLQRDAEGNVVDSAPYGDGSCAIRYPAANDTATTAPAPASTEAAAMATPIEPRGVQPPSEATEELTFECG